MYLVEQSPGREILFKSPAELAAAIRSGQVNAESRIFHRTTSTWLPITVHPAYRQLIASGARSAEGSATLYPPLPRKQWTFLPLDSEPEPRATPQPSAEGDRDTASPAGQPAVKPRRRLRFWR